MKEYTSNTYYLIDKLFYLLVFSGLIGYFVYSLDNNNKIQIAGIVIISIFLILFIRLTTKLASIKFTESKITVKYLITRKVLQIYYSSIIEIQYISGYQISSLNIIKYKSDNIAINKVKLTSVVSQDKYIEFAKWIKNKNNKIEFKFFPPDLKLKSEFNKEFK